MNRIMFRDFRLVLLGIAACGLGFGCPAALADTVDPSMIPPDVTYTPSAPPAAPAAAATGTPGAAPAAGGGAPGLAAPAPGSGGGAPPGVVSGSPGVVNNP